MKKLKIICDGNKSIGFGHVRRSLTLGEEFSRQGWDVYIECISDGFEQLIPDTFKVPFESEVVLLDFWHDIDSWIEKLKGKVKLVCLDYYGELSPDLSIVIFEKLIKNYQHKRLCGGEYILIREDITSLKEEVTDPYILVSIGGADIENVGIQIANLLVNKNLAVKLIEGPLASYGKVDKRIEKIHAPQNFPQLLKNCSLAISNGGGTLFELMYLNKPVFCLPQNEIESKLIEEKFMSEYVLGKSIDDIRTKINEGYSTKFKSKESIIDGDGAKRIVQALEELCNN